MKFIKSKQLNNKGLSLVELIVTILIVAIISGGAAISFNVVYNANTDRAAKRLVAALAETREMAMAGDDDYTFLLRLYMEGNNTYAAMYRNDRSGALIDTAEPDFVKEVGNDRVTISFAKKDDTDFKTLGTDYSEVYFAFGKKRGELTSTAVKDMSGTFASEDGLIDIKVVSNKENEVIIVPATGRSYIYNQ